MDGIEDRVEETGAEARPKGLSNCDEQDESEIGSSRILTFISFNFESLLFLKSAISSSNLLTSAEAVFCFSLA